MGVRPKARGGRAGPAEASGKLGTELGHGFLGRGADGNSPDPGPEVLARRGDPPAGSATRTYATVG